MPACCLKTITLLSANPLAAGRSLLTDFQGCLRLGSQYLTTKGSARSVSFTFLRIAHGLEFYGSKPAVFTTRVMGGWGGR